MFIWCPDVLTRHLGRSELLIGQGRICSVANAHNSQVTMNRRNTGDRRSGQHDRRKQEAPVAAERRAGQRRKVQRRRQIDPTTCERDYTTEEIEFMQAMDAYKRASGRMFPTCSEILEVIRNLGYAKVLDSGLRPNLVSPEPTCAADASI